MLRSRAWGGQPFPGKYANKFAAGFAKLHDTTYGQCMLYLEGTLGSASLTPAFRYEHVRVLNGPHGK